MHWISERFYKMGDTVWTSQSKLNSQILNILLFFNWTLIVLLSVLYFPRSNPIPYDLDTGRPLKMVRISSIVILLYTLSIYSSVRVHNQLIRTLFQAHIHPSLKKRSHSWFWHFIHYLSIPLFTISCVDAVRRQCHWKNHTKLPWMDQLILSILSNHFNWKYYLTVLIGPNIIKPLLYYFLI